MTEKNAAVKQIQDMAEVFAMSGDGFQSFYKEANQNSSGNGSQSASSGDYSQSASSGNGSKSASSGNYSQSASSGNYSKSASSGYNSRSASSGDDSKSASSGDYSQSASSGNGSQSASSGDYSKSASSGDYSQSASSGNYSKSASSGNGSKSASSGNYSQSASSGNYSKSASSGYNSRSASSGYNSACSALGFRAAVCGDLGNLIMASEYVETEGGYAPVGGKADIIDGKALKPNRWYIVEKAQWVEVDFTDGIFGYVLSNKGSVKKIKTDGGKILYIVHDDNGNSAHGKTIKEAWQDLIYKNVAKFDGVVPEQATGAEWIGLYRAITGACGVGVKMFVEEVGVDLNKSYTATQIDKMTVGRFGHDAFVQAMKGGAQ